MHMDIIQSLFYILKKSHKHNYHLLLTLLYSYPLKKIILHILNCLPIVLPPIRGKLSVSEEAFQVKPQVLCVNKNDVSPKMHAIDLFFCVCVISWSFSRKDKGSALTKVAGWVHVLKSLKKQNLWMRRKEAAPWAYVGAQTLDNDLRA